MPLNYGRMFILDVEEPRLAGCCNGGRMCYPRKAHCRRVVAFLGGQPRETWDVQTDCGVVTMLERTGAMQHF